MSIDVSLILFIFHTAHAFSFLFKLWFLNTTLPILNHMQLTSIIVIFLYSCFLLNYLYIEFFFLKLFLFYMKYDFNSFIIFFQTVAINKAINSQVHPVKEKHVRSIFFVHIHLYVILYVVFCISLISSLNSYVSIWK